MIYYTRDEVERIGRAGALQIIDEDGSQMFRYLSSFWLYVEPQDEAFTPHGLTGYWESWITKWLSKQFDSHDKFFDVGANVGYYTMMAANHGIQTVAVEPLPHLCKMIRKSADENKLISKIEIANFALSDEPNVGIGFIRLFENHSGGSYLADEGIEVKVHTFDNGFVSQRGKRVLMKIDAEGQEPNIIRGMTNSLAAADFTIVLEWQAQRWSDPGKFYDELVEKFNDVSIVTHLGIEEKVDKEFLVNSTDLHMVVVRSAAIR